MTRHHAHGLSDALCVMACQDKRIHCARASNILQTLRDKKARRHHAFRFFFFVRHGQTRNDGGATTTNFAYNGDGTRVSREVVGVGTTYYIGNHYEIYKPNAGTTTFNKYYYFGSQRIAARINGTLFYMQGDHLGSSSLVMTSGGALNTRQTYYPYGAKRVFDGSALPTDYTFTVTRHHT